jgi:DNA-binding beta-propeller fold protein YncE
VPQPATLPVAPSAAASVHSTSLLYVSDYETNDVYAYAYPGGKLRLTLRGVLKNAVLPAGLCADERGDVFVPDSSNSTVLVYAHGSTKPLRTLSDRGGLPYGCAVDPTTGDLAVTNLETFTGAGNVAVYRRSKGVPQTYSYGFVYKYYFCAYDDSGDLFVAASENLPSEPFVLLELPRGSGALSSIALTRSIAIAGGVAWDGEYLAIADSQSSVIYRFAISGSAGTEVGKTVLRHGRFVTQFFIDGGRVVGADYRGASVGFWRYPGGGAPEKTIGGLGEPFGVTLSS